MARKPQPKTTKTGASRAPRVPRRCGLCGKTDRLTKTSCCRRWICDDEDEYVMFSFARNSCHRNHDRYTLCSTHHHEGHAGPWQGCQKCRERLGTEMYVYCGTNEHNFEKLVDPPAYEPTTCARCGQIIRLGHDGYTMAAEGTFCATCSEERLARLPRAPTTRSN
jgi:hypothetical protein